MVSSGSEVTYNAVEDTSMAGNNGSPLVEYPEDRVGPTRDAPERLFYVYAPTIHWHMVLHVMVACGLPRPSADSHSIQR